MYESNRALLPFSPYVSINCDSLLASRSAYRWKVTTMPVSKNGNYRRQWCYALGVPHQPATLTNIYKWELSQGNCVSFDLKKQLSFSKIAFGYTINHNHDYIWHLFLLLCIKSKVIDFFFTVTSNQLTKKKAEQIKVLLDCPLANWISDT